MQFGIRACYNEYVLIFLKGEQDMLYTEYREFNIYGGDRITEISIRTTSGWGEENDQYITEIVKGVAQKSPQAMIRLETQLIERKRLDESIEDALKLLRAEPKKPFWMD